MTTTNLNATTASAMLTGSDALPLVLSTLFLGGLLMIFFLFRSKRSSSSSSTSLPYPPSPPGRHFLWGHAHLFPDMSQGHHVDPQFLEWAKELGPVFSLEVPIMGPMIVVAEPALLKHIAVTQNYDKSWTYAANIPLFGTESILTKHGEEWKRLRKTFAPGFTTTFLKDMVTVMCDKLDRFQAVLDSEVNAGSETNMMNRAQTFTSDVIVQIAFGEDWGGDRPHVARGYITDLTESIILIDKDLKTRLFGFAHKRRIKVLERKIEDVMQQVLDRRLEQLEKEEQSENDISTTNNKDKAYANVCTLAIDSMRKERPDGMLTDHDRTAILHQLKSFYFAGHDTTATTIAWAIWLLSQHAQVLDKLRAELTDKQVFTTPDQRPTYAQLQDCEYLDAVVKEVLRLYPPGASARYSYDETQSWNDTWKLGKAVLYLNCYVLHRLPQYWDRPDDFWPERFVAVPPEDYAHKYIPFLKGPRDCLGKYFALLEAKLAVSALAQRYDMDCVNPDGERVGYRITAAPMDGARVKFTLRA